MRRYPIVIVAALVVLEVGLRAAGALPAHPVILGGVFGDYPLIEHAGFVSLAPRYRGRIWGRPFRTNRHGFRSPPIRRERESANELRVLLLGSCITLGEIDDTKDGFSIFGRTLERELQFRRPGLRVRVINAAVPGSYEPRDLAYYRAFLADFDPDLVLVENGTAQIVDPAWTLDEALAKGTAAPAGNGWKVRERLYDVFDRSLLVSYYYALRRNQGALFRRFFYRRPEAFEAEGESRVEVFVQEVMRPSAEHYRRNLRALYSALAADAPVLAYTFPHALPQREFEELKPVERRRLARLELMLSMPAEMNAGDLWQLFRRSFELVTKVTAEEAAAHGVYYVELSRDVRLRNPAYYDPYYYYLPRSEGSRRKGEVLADYILEHYELAPGDTKPIEKEPARV